MAQSRMMHSHHAVLAVCQTSSASATRLSKVNASALPTVLYASSDLSESRPFRNVPRSPKANKECPFKFQLQGSRLGITSGSSSMAAYMIQSRFNCRRMSVEVERGWQSQSTQSGVVAESSDEQDTGTDTRKTDEASNKSPNGAAAGQELPSGEMEYVKLGALDSFLVQLRLLLVWPWRRVKKGSVLKMKLGGEIAERYQGRFSKAVSLPQLCQNLVNAAHDPRIGAVFLQIQPLDCGWGKIDEIRRHMEYFKKSGKPLVGYLPVGNEKEYYLACACGELYAPPGAYISLRGLKVQATFVGGVLEKAGIEPQFQRIGKYKSFGDTITRKQMSEANREMLTAVLDDVFDNWSEKITSSTGKTRDELLELLDKGVAKIEELKADGWITDIKYEDEVDTLLINRLGGDKDKPLVTVDYRKYSKVRAKTLGLSGGRDRIAVIRAVGGISLSKGGGLPSQSEGIVGETFIQTIRQVRESKDYKAVVLRIDSPGGDALASDLMWRELRLLAEKKPVVASMVDVAASGGYYMAMAAGVIVAEELTLTGSIGVVTGKFNLKELYERIGYGKEVISRGKFAELDADQRAFTPEEEDFFKLNAMTAYKLFRDKAALSRKMEVDAMEEVAQGRVWTGKAALSRGLVDAIGGFNRAVAIAKQKAGIAESAQVTLVELSRKKPNLLQLLQGGGGVQTLSLLALLFDTASITDFLGRLERGTLLLGNQQGVQARMDDIQVGGLGQVDPPQASTDDISVQGLGNSDNVLSMLAKRLGDELD